MLIAAFVLLVAAVVWAVNTLIGYGVAGLVVALVVAGAAAFVSYWKSDSRATTPTMVTASVETSRS